MPTSFVLALATVVVVLLLARLTVRARPVTPWARAIAPRDAAAAGLGVIGLLLHCVSMFNQPLIGDVPGVERYAIAVNQMGESASPSSSPQHVCCSLDSTLNTAPCWRCWSPHCWRSGSRMYDGGRLVVHLIYIFVSVVLLGITATLLITEVARPDRARPLE